MLDVIYWPDEHRETAQVDASGINLKVDDSSEAYPNITSRLPRL